MKKTITILTFLMLFVGLYAGPSALDKYIKIKYITVLSSDSMEVAWEPWDSLDVFYYFIRKGEFDPWDPSALPRFAPQEVYAVSGRLTSVARFEYDEMNNQSVVLGVNALDSIKESVSGSLHHASIFLQGQYDTCNSSIILNWTQYYGWNILDPIYNVYVNGELVGTSNTTEYFVKNIVQNKAYTFNIELSDGLYTTSSNYYKYFTKMPINPSFVTAHSLTDNGSEVRLKFSTDVQSELNTLRLYETDYFEHLVGVKDITKEPESVLQVKYQNDKNTCWFYSAIDMCDNPVVSSEPLCKIRLESNVADDIINLDWEVNSKLNFDELQLVMEDNTGTRTVVDGNIFSYNQQIEDLISDEFEGVITYYVVIKAGDAIMYSNKEVLDLYGYVRAPEAFTPDGNGVNDIFKPKLVTEPDNYSMEIFAEYGNRIFSTHNYEEGWDGTTSNGKEVATAPYWYHLKYSINGVEKAYNGSIVVVYP